MFINWTLGMVGILTKFLDIRRERKGAAGSTRIGPPLGGWRAERERKLSEYFTLKVIKIHSKIIKFSLKRVLNYQYAVKEE